MRMITNILTKAKNTIIEEIINAQDTDVDTVSGQLSAAGA